MTRTPRGASQSRLRREKAKAGGQSDEQIADQLKAFCVKWMGFLETRERDNKKGIKWEKKPAGIAGHYVGYSKEYDCVMKERSSNGTPVATIQYKEYVYEKTGASQGEARAEGAEHRRSHRGHRDLPLQQGAVGVLGQGPRVQGFERA